MPAPAIVLVPNTKPPCVMLGVRVSSGDLGSTMNCCTGCAAFGSTSLTPPPDAALARWASGQVSSPAVGHVVGVRVEVRVDEPARHLLRLGPKSAAR